MTEMKLAENSAHEMNALSCLFENLRGAAWVFQEQDKDEGCLYACRAIASFIKANGWSPILAAPFMHIAGAFKAQSDGINATLFSNAAVAEGERSRSPERKHIQRLAAALLEVLVRCTAKESVQEAARYVACVVSKWSHMRAQDVTGTTVDNWRSAYKLLQDNQFDLIVEETLSQPDPVSYIEYQIRNGPPGYWYAG